MEIAAFNYFPNLCHSPANGYGWIAWLKNIIKVYHSL